MKRETEEMIRNLVKVDGEIDPNDAERALNVLRGVKEGTEELVHVMKRKDVIKLLGIHRRTLDYYVSKGYLDNVYGGGQRAIGISRESFIRFTTKRVHRKW